MDELNSVLELATEEELQQITQILFRRRFNPLDYWQTPEPIYVQSQDWDSWLTSLDRRFRYLAADGFTVLRNRTQELSYRQILIQVCHYLKIPYSQQMNTTNIEAEIFLHLVSKAWDKLPAEEQLSLQQKIGTSLATANPPEALPVQLQHDPLKILLKGSSIFAVNSLLKTWLLKHIAQQFAIHFATYQTAKAALIKGGTVAVAGLQSQLALQTAKRGMAVNAARYGVTRSVFGLIGPIMWGYFVADLGWKAIATNYSRVIPIIFTLAQIRLTRGEYWATA
ncbi:YaaW family protein [Myxosarcina sp. GI1]|uniref:YaaW family protein n=1 Tax=Myxosarcina sp. GI1 TaxID=1541065 RepID=UPI00055E74D7